MSNVDSGAGKQQSVTGKVTGKGWGLNICRPSSVQPLVNARVHLYTYQLCDSVDVDLSFLQACTEEHRC